MPSTTQSQLPFHYRHVPKNILLIFLGLFCVPISVFIFIASYIASYLQRAPQVPHAAHDGSRKTILITGVSMTKGLTISRLLSHNTFHHIIGADVESVPLTSPGRYSRSISKFLRLSAPIGENAKPYIDSLLSVLRGEKVDIWVSCSSVICAVEDAEVVQLAKKELGPNFKAVQFAPDIIETLHSKDRFVEYIESLGLPVPETYRCDDSEKLLNILLGEQEKEKGDRKKYIMKPIGVDDRARNNMMTLLPFSSSSQTISYVHSLDVSRVNPFILQQYISGPEYCTHALVVCGKVKALVACPSSELLMHYEALHPNSELSRKMLEFTKKVAQDKGEEFTGHLSFDFLAEGEGEDVMLYPIECNPRAHTAVVLFQDEPGMATAYARIAEEERHEEKVLLPKVPCSSYYWVGNDLLTLAILPLLDLLAGNGTVDSLRKSLGEFMHHLLYWKEGSFTLWDPLPFLVLYHVYWPVQFINSIAKGKQWSRINVSTTKMFEC